MEILALLEQRVDARGDLMALATTFDNDRGCSITRTATLQDGRVFDTHTYGRRGAMPTRDNIAIHGVALDGKLALSEFPGRALEPSELTARVAAGQALSYISGPRRTPRCCGRGGDRFWRQPDDSLSR